MIPATRSPGSSNQGDATSLRLHLGPPDIALSETPSYLATLDYARRWGIGPMFSDFKTRGFGLEDSQMRHHRAAICAIAPCALCPRRDVGVGDRDRLARLILVTALVYRPRLLRHLAEP